jgi:hypothetical protein
VNSLIIPSQFRKLYLCNLNYDVSSLNDHPYDWNLILHNRYKKTSVASKCKNKYIDYQEQIPLWLAIASLIKIPKHEDYLYIYTALSSRIPLREYIEFINKSIKPETLLVLSSGISDVVAIVEDCG